MDYVENGYAHARGRLFTLMWTPANCKTQDRDSIVYVSARLGFMWVQGSNGTREELRGAGRLAAW
jgi:hypothetical protein